MIFDLTKDHILENEFVLLRPLKDEDLYNLLPFALHEAETWKYSLVSAAGSEGLRTYINLALDAKKKKTEYPFIVYDKRKQKYAGCTRFYDIQLPNNMLQLGYTWYGKEFRGTVLNKACKFLLLEFAFEKMNMERVEFRADNGNERSIAAMKSIGCTVEGVIRSHAQRPDGTRRDSIILSILKPEWLGHLKSELEKKMRAKA
jgi:RimJ/RimL family protein N-acetyltransferase